MYLDDLIAQLQVTRAQYGNLQVWLNPEPNFTVQVTVGDMLPQDRKNPPEKVLYIG
jgi:hypothetical protein